MFEKPYCRELIALGYGDASARKQEILDFLGVHPAPVARQGSTDYV